MSWRWSYRSFPEFADTDPGVRDRVWKRCLARANRDPRAWLVLAGFAATAPAALAARELCVQLGVGDDGSLAAVAATGLAAAWALVRAYAGVARGYVRAELPGVCRGCGYDLTGNASGTCPECGTAATAKEDA